jgi:hypothetical protein
MVLQGKGGEALLDSYNDERLENARNLVNSTDRMFNFLAGGDWFLNLVRTHLFPRLMGKALGVEAIRTEFFKRLSQIGISYRSHGLAEHSGDEHFDVKAGDRFPYFLIDGKSVYDRLHEPKFHLVTFADGASNHAGWRDQIQLQCCDLIEHHVLPLYPRIAEIFGSTKPFHVMLRPDNYVAFITTDNPDEALKAYMGRLAA